MKIIIRTFIVTFLFMINGGVNSYALPVEALPTFQEQIEPLASNETIVKEKKEKPSSVTRLKKWVLANLIGYLAGTAFVLISIFIAISLNSSAALIVFTVLYLLGFLLLFASSILSVFLLFRIYRMLKREEKKQKSPKKF